MQTAVYIGRFEPPHDGHLRIMRAALARHGRLLVLLGSANLARSAKNPFTAQERAGMIRTALAAAGEDLSRVRLRPLPDEFDPERWAAQVRRSVHTKNAVLVGFGKDASSSYLGWFPDWQLEPSPVLAGLSATDIRAAYFEGRAVEQVPHATAAFLEQFRSRPLFGRLQREYLALKALAQQPKPSGEVRYFWQQQGHLWLSRRTGPIGFGLWELDGHYLTVGEAAPAHTRVFEAPTRSLLGQIPAYVLRGQGEGQAVPLELALRRPHRFFEDHHVIVQRMLAEKS